MTENHLRTILLLSAINDNNVDNRISLIEELELGISRMLNAERTNNDENTQPRSSLSRNHSRRNNLFSRSDLRSQLSARTPVTIYNLTVLIVNLSRNRNQKHFPQVAQDQ